MGALSKALAGAGQAMYSLGLEEFKNQAAARREERLMEFKLKAQKPQAEEYTLGPGQKRYRGDQLIAEVAAEPKSIQTEEIYDPESPTGTRIVNREEALGQPGKSTHGITIGPDGTVQIGGSITKPPQGYRYTNEGNLEPIPGGPEDPNAKAKAATTGLFDAISAAREILTGEKINTSTGKVEKIPGWESPTSSGIGTGVDYVATLFGATTSGAKEADRLRAIGGVLTSKMPRMEGPQSNYDVELYREMAGRVGDSSLPSDRRLAALDTIEQLWKKYGNPESLAQPQDSKKNNIAPNLSNLPKGFKIIGVE